MRSYARISDAFPLGPICAPSHSPAFRGRKKGAGGTGRWLRTVSSSCASADRLPAPCVTNHGLPWAWPSAACSHARCTGRRCESRTESASWQARGAAQRCARHVCRPYTDRAASDGRASHGGRRNYEGTATFWQSIRAQRALGAAALHCTTFAGAAGTSAWKLLTHDFCSTSPERARARSVEPMTYRHSSVCGECREVSSAIGPRRPASRTEPQTCGVRIWRKVKNLLYPHSQPLVQQAFSV